LTSPLYRIPVVYHVFLNSQGGGGVSDATLKQQIAILNEHFLGQDGTLGEASYNSRIMFYLATYDTTGASTSGIERFTSQTCFNQTLWSAADTLCARTYAWRPQDYLNFYVIGNVDFGWAVFPWRDALTRYDGVRVGYKHVGRPVSDPVPESDGRTAVHEVGHYLGLFHTSKGGSCDSLIGTACFRNHDLLCDTDWENFFDFYNCEGNELCGTNHGPPFNQMSLHADSCRTFFTKQQVARMRCSLVSYRPVLADSIAVTISSSSHPDSARLLCPQGEQSAKVVVTVDFAEEGMRRAIAARELVLAEPAGTTAYRLWPAAVGDSVFADSAATASNDYRTTFTIRRLSGCADDSVIVRLDGIPIGKAYINAKSADFLPASPGAVDASDIPPFAQHLGCPGPSCPTAYDACFDLDPFPADGHVDQSDVIGLAVHLGHDSPSNKVLSGVGEVAIYRVSEATGRLSTSISLERVGAFTTAAVVLQIDPNALWFADWSPNIALDGIQIFAVPVADGLGSRVVLLVFSRTAPPGSESVTLGTLEWTTERPINLEADVTLAYAALTRADGSVGGLSRSGKPGQPASVVPLTDRLEPGQPNPFNPRTVIEYAVSADVDVLLAIYDVHGRRVRVLVNGRQRKNVYRVDWDGAATDGRPLASGIYLAKLMAGQYQRTQKLVLVR
jgi:hypothetical protein